MPKRTALACAAAVALFSAAAASAQDKAGEFDFYVLALSWSPTFCATGEKDGDSAQCRDEADFGFIVHGLWPQHERGYPESCATTEPQRVPLNLAEEMLDIMPDRGLVFSQWRRHGTCTGLSQSAYFSTVRAAKERVTVPPEFTGVREDARMSADAAERAFLRSNPGMEAGGIAVICEAGALEEVRICLTRDLDFRECTEVDSRACRQSELNVPAPG